MIKITGIELEDFGRHKRIKQEFSGNVIGLAGPNGKGKSTVIQALQLGLTGNIEHPDSLSDFIRKSSEEQAPKKARVKVNFVADGKRGSITRVIGKNTTSRELEWEGLDAGTKSLTADKRVAEVLFDILGVDKKAINSTVFIGQGELGKMFGKDTERREFYTRLLMLGHLEKVADVVDTFRKQVADSTQDLTPLKDAASDTLDQSTAIAKECRRELESMSRPHLEIAEALKLVGLFNQHSAAELAFSDAESAVSAVAPGARIFEMVADWEKAAAELQSKIDANNLSRRTYVALTNSVTMCRENLSKFTEALNAYASLDAAELALSQSAALDTPDPTPIIEVMNGYLRSLARITELEVSIPMIAGEIAELEVQLAKADTSGLDDLWEKSNKEYGALRSDLDLRLKLRSELSGKHTTNCAVCGSDCPDQDYLSNTIDTITPKVEEMSVSLKALLSARTDAAAKAASLHGDLMWKTKSLTGLKDELARLKITMMGVGGADVVTAKRDKAVVDSAAYIASASERKRLTAVRDSCLAAVSGVVRPDASDVEKHSAAFRDSQAALDALVFDPDIDSKDKAAHEELADIRRRQRSAESAYAAYEAASNNVQTAEVRLSEALTSLPNACPPLYNRLATHGTLTLELVTSVADDMRVEQTAYDNQAGKTTAAEQAAERAADSLAKIDQRIAEQGVRRDLVLDLTKLRDTFKPQGASLSYLNYKFEQIAAMTADYLAESQADFMIAASQEIPLAFEFVRLDRPDEVWMPQNRMSGGQKVRLAVAALRAIHALVMPDVGLLVLDEPTTHLDDDAVKAMAEMLRKIGDEGTLQMIVCDHNPVLIDAFSDLIEIPE